MEDNENETADQAYKRAIYIAARAVNVKYFCSLNGKKAPTHDLHQFFCILDELISLHDQAQGIDT